MLWYYAPALLMLLQSAFSFPRDKTTEKPVSVMANPKQRRPTHISEFTDPDTGLNPFLDLEEGLGAEMGRNVMEDERRDYESHFDIDLVEGDTPGRRWNLQEPKEHPGRVPARRPELDYKDESDYFAVVTTPLIVPNPPTTAESVVTRGMDGTKSDAIEEEGDKEIEHKFKKEEQESFVQSTVIYATTAVAVMTVAILLVGACWWRKKSKTMRPSASSESGEVKS